MNRCAWTIHQRMKVGARIMWLLGPCKRTPAEGSRYCWQHASMAVRQANR